MKLRIEKSVTVITPTIGSEKLFDAMESVSRQTYKNIKHLIVIDGHDYADKARKTTSRYPQSHVMQLPYNTGANGFYGHRVYAGVPHLINTDYIAFLDEDNWYEPEHIASLVETIEEDVIDASIDSGKKRDFQFAYSLRKIYSPDKRYLTDDNCESLGKWPIFFTHDNPQYLVDTSSYLFKREFLIQSGHVWHHGWGGDRRYYNAVRTFDHNCSGKHTMCYRLDGNQNSVTEEFFIQGNQIQSQKYNNKFPWIRQ